MWSAKTSPRTSSMKIIFLVLRDNIILGYSDYTYNWEKVITVHPIFWRLVQKIKFQKYLVLYIGRIAQTLRVISFKKHLLLAHAQSEQKYPRFKKSHFAADSTKWAESSEFVSSSIPSWQISTAHAQPFRGARELAFCLKVPLDSLLVYASSEGSGETARMRRLAWTFAARIGDKYQIRLARPKCSLWE